MYGLTQTVRGSRILYTPVEGDYGDMSVTLQVAPCKSAGQGFGSATAQYMDVLLKMDTENLNGYALRIERTGKYSNAVDFKLMKYTDGMAEAISEPISASCYNTRCTIVLKLEGTTLSAHVETTKKQNDEQAAAGLAHTVDLSAEVEPNMFGGVGVTHTGTAGANATLLTQLKVVWEEGAIVEPTVASTEVPTEAPTAVPTETPVSTTAPTEMPSPTAEQDCGMEDEESTPADETKDEFEQAGPTAILKSQVWNTKILIGIAITIVAAVALVVVAVVQKKKQK